MKYLKCFKWALSLFISLRENKLFLFWSTKKNLHSFIQNFEFCDHENFTSIIAVRLKRNSAFSFIFLSFVKLNKQIRVGKIVFQLQQLASDSKKMLSGPTTLLENFTDDTIA